jgi:isopentenyldiphosphate isomerase
MAFVDRIRDCNGWRPENFLPFVVAGRALGWIRPSLAAQLKGWPAVFEVRRDSVWLDPSLCELETRTWAVADVLGQLSQDGVLPPLHGELFPVGLTWDRPDLLIDRQAAAWFGVRAYGQHMNGFVREGERLWMWVGRRASRKRNYPRRLDHLVAGGLPHGISRPDNLLKECWEEAGIPAALASQARPVGALTYCRETQSGLKPDTIYCYDLQLQRGFRPRCTDGEVDDFFLLPIEEVAELVRDTEEFKPNCSLVIIDFLLRHGILTPESDAYLELVQGLHPSLPALGPAVDG